MHKPSYVHRLFQTFIMIILRKSINVICTSLSSWSRVVLFEMYDADGDGFVDKNDMLSLMKLMIGSELSEAQISEIVEKTLQDLDEDKDGKLSYQEFAKVISLKCCINN